MRDALAYGAILASVIGGAALDTFVLVERPRLYTRGALSRLCRRLPGARRLTSFSFRAFQTSGAVALVIMVFLLLQATETFWFIAAYGVGMVLFPADDLLTGDEPKRRWRRVLNKVKWRMKLPPRPALDPA